ncbi:MAG: cell division protein FtsA [Proteobacteria bacterium]|nr:cell division protein FtsA [Pseudomonadota bacterium]
MNAERYTLPAALDIGNGTIRVLIAEALADGSLVVLGVGEEQSAGMEEGRIINLHQATEALKRALRTAEIDSGRKIEQVLVGISGEYIKSCANEGKAVVRNSKAVAGGGEEGRYHVAGGVVEKGDIDKVREMVVAAASAGEIEILDIIEKTYSLDRQLNIRNPLGMNGKLLTGSMHAIVAERQSLENVETCINQAGITLADKVVFSGLAAAQAVLNEEEKRLGVCLLDIGAHTTEMVIFCNGGVYETDVYLEAGNLIHMDISTVHHTTLSSAEQCKKQAGVLVPPVGNEMLPLVSTSGEEVNIGHSLVLRTITSRVEELLNCVDNTLRNFEKKEARKLTAGIVLTGGGALLPGLIPMMTNRLHIPVRIGAPTYNGEKRERLKAPQFSVSLGLLMIGCERAQANYKLPWMTRATHFFFNSFHIKEKKHGQH